MLVQAQKKLLSRVAFGLLLLFCIGLTACAIKASENRPVREKTFTGFWHVKWCDKRNPNLDCGGFNITLIQNGDRICGDFGGALVNLRQTDEGTIVGTKVGNTAILAVESMRNQSILLVRVERIGDKLHWKAVDQIRRGEGDIDVIGTDELLTRAATSASSSPRHLEPEQNCDSFNK